MNKLILFTIGSLCFLSCCTTNSKTSNEQQTVAAQPLEHSSTPSFDADSAYHYIQQQVDFGPRVPNSEAHKQCARFLENKLRQYGATIYLQEVALTAYDGSSLAACNIIGSFYPEKERRIMLFGHWDTRPCADQEENEAKRHQPIDGADDGGSGIGVMLEIARQLSLKAPDVGIDLVFFDAEDHGYPDFATQKPANSWCLGSQYWAEHPHIPHYKAEYGICLDMVGTKDASFYKELVSLQYAAPHVERIWEMARRLGYGKYFINAKGGAIVDDHLYVNRGRQFPCLDIINFDPTSKKGFGHYWHTLNDTMENIDRETLKAVGQTMLEVIYQPE